MKDLETIKNMIQETRDNIEIEYNNAIEWNKDAKERYDKDVKFFWKDWCDNWEYLTSLDVLNTEKNKLNLINIILSYFD